MGKTVFIKEWVAFCWLLIITGCSEPVELTVDASQEATDLNEIILSHLERPYAVSMETIDSVREVASRTEGADYAVLASEAILKFRDYRLVESLPLFLQALDLAEEGKDLHLIGATCQEIARIHVTLGKPKEALQYEQRSYEAWQKLGLDEKRAHSLNFQGMMARADEDYSGALQYYQTAMEVFKRLSIDEGLLPTLDQIGNLYMTIGDEERASKYFHEAYELAQQMPLTWQVPATVSLASFYRKTDKHLDAIRLYESASKLAGEENHIEQANICLGIGRAYISLENWDMAKEKLFQSLASLEKIEAPFIEVWVHKELTVVFEALNDADQALFYYKEYMPLAKDVEARNNKEGLDRIMTDFQLEKKDLEIEAQSAELRNKDLIQYAMSAGLALLMVIIGLVTKNYFSSRRSAKKIEEQRDMISKNLEERETLLKEIHHRVKNNLQIIANLLYLQSSKAEDENIKDVLEEGQGRVRSMSLIHQKLYENDDLKSIPFEEYLMELVQEIQNSFGDEGSKVKINIQAQQVFFDVENAVPLGLIINELTTNTFKYAFDGKKKGEYNIYLTREDGHYELHVSDNGKGLPEEIDIRKTRSLGLRLVRVLSNQLEGQYHFENDGGMNFKLRFAA